MTLSLLRTATKVPSVKAAVVTSTSAAIYTPEFGKDIHLSLEDYHETSEATARAAPEDSPHRGAMVYMAAKTRAEQALWKWVADTKVC